MGNKYNYFVKGCNLIINEKVVSIILRESQEMKSVFIKEHTAEKVIGM